MLLLLQNSTVWNEPVLILSFVSVGLSRFIGLLFRYNKITVSIILIAIIEMIAVVVVIYCNHE